MASIAELHSRIITAVRTDGAPTPEEGGKIIIALLNVAVSTHAGLSGCDDVSAEWLRDVVHSMSEVLVNRSNEWKSRN